MDESCCSLKQDVPEVSEPSVRKAACPFDEDDADATLRTSDNVLFRVHRVILSLASSIFKDMFSMPQPPTGSSDPIPVAEDETTLHTFLCICYPIPNAKPTSLVQIRKVLAAAVKYDVPLVTDQMRHALMAPEFLDAQPLVVFSIACIFHMEEVAQAAAETAVTVHNFGASLGNHPKLDDVSAGAYFRLLRLYRTRTGGGAVVEPSVKRRKKRKSNATSLEPQYTVNFQGITPFCRPSLLRTLPATKSQFESVSDPFTDTRGDLVLRASDAFDFYVHRSIVTFASPTFLDTLVASVETEGRSSMPAVPVYQIEESAAILDVLLRICYPVPHLLPADPDMFLAVLFAAHKYGMSKAKQILRGGWPDLVKANPGPMRLYFVAVELGWRQEGMACADQLASLPIADVRAIYNPEMESICSAPYRNLLVYIESKRQRSGGQLQWDQVRWVNIMTGRELADQSHAQVYRRVNNPIMWFAYC